MRQGRKYPINFRASGLKITLANNVLLLKGQAFGPPNNKLCHMGYMKKKLVELKIFFYCKYFMAFVKIDFFY